MKPEERNDYRMKKLKELYDYHFENNQRAKNVIQEIKQDSEARAAYSYLYEKGLINYKEQGTKTGIIYADAKINANGIDVIENDKSLR